MLEWESFIKKTQMHKDKLNQNQPDIVKRVNETTSSERKTGDKEEARKGSGVTIQQMMNTGVVERMSRQCTMTM